FYFRSRQTTTRLSVKDSIVLAEFTNTTGDPVFDGTLRQGLSAQLEQSPFLNLLSDERVAQTLALIAQPKDARLTRELARQLDHRRYWLARPASAPRALPLPKAQSRLLEASMLWG